MPNTMPGNIAKGRFLAQLDALINGLPEVDPSSVDRKTLRADLAAFTAGEPDNPFITKKDDIPLPAPNCLIDKWVKPKYTTSTSVGLKRWKRDRRHLYKHWFPNPPWKGNLASDPAEDEKSVYGGWFEEHQPVARVVRQGLIHALDLLAGGNRIFDSYWVCAGSHLEVTNILSPVTPAKPGTPANEGTLTCLFLTPAPPFTRRGKNFKAGFEDIYVSKHRSLQPGEKEILGVSPDPYAITVRLARPR